MTTQTITVLPGIPADLIGWTWESRDLDLDTREYRLHSPSRDWATKWYQTAEKALAEAHRRVLSAPKKAAPAPASTDAAGLRFLAIQQIRRDGGTQSRAALNEETITDYADAMEDLLRIPNGLSQFPPLIVFYDGTDYWLADGFHRVEAYERVLGRTITA